MLTSKDMSLQLLWYESYFILSAGNILAQTSPINRSCGTNVAGWSPKIITGLAVGKAEPITICYGAKGDSRGECYKKLEGEVFLSTFIT